MIIRLYIPKPRYEGAPRPGYWRFWRMGLYPPLSSNVVTLSWTITTLDDGELGL